MTAGRRPGLTGAGVTRLRLAWPGGWEREGLVREEVLLRESGMSHLQ